MNILKYYDLETGIYSQDNRKNLTGLSRGVMWSALLFRSYFAAAWRLEWKSQSEQGLQGYGSGQEGAIENYTNEVALGRAWSEQIQRIYERVDLMRFND